ncbi:putative succinate-semialdehyde dehydrogenase [NADP(+)] 2 [bacterium BMS3Bbin03]|nr:putative succinate-semialdehyde dehydrogenase [NADP(+)] 2 [bacterium BMS3Bbin03]
MPQEAALITREAQTPSVNPATKEILGYTPVNSVEDLKQAIRQARAAQKVWAVYPFQKRAKILKRTRDYLVEHASEWAEIVSHDNGKVRLDALITDVLSSAISMSYYLKHAKKLLKDKKIRPGSLLLFNKYSIIIRVPFGVVGIISPWNYPITIPFHEIILGLMSGNAVIFKTATETQMAGKAIKAAIENADLPDGLFAFINMPGRVAGDAFFDNGIDKLFFTGSVPVGKRLMAKAAQTLTPVSLELGGNDPVIICEDADPERAVMGTLWAGFSNTGQTCGGVERVYVHENIYDRYMKLLKEKVESLRVGYDTDFNVDVGAMTTSEQVEVVKTHIKDALEKGAVIFARSKAPDDPNLHNFLPAMVLTNVNHEMLLMKEETFGPVVGVMKVKTMEEAIALANDSSMGLSASIWSKNQKNAEKIARQIQAGSVMINDHLSSHGMAETPWGGFKESGIGRTHGEFGFLEMTQPKVIVKDRLSFAKRDLWWHPYSKKLYDGILGSLNLLYGKNMGARLKGLWKLLKIVPRMFKTE